MDMLIFNILEQGWSLRLEIISYRIRSLHEKAQVGKDQEKAQSEKDSPSRNRDGKILN